MEYIILFLFLVMFEKIYFKLAMRYKIIDKPNVRSSHTVVTLRGGGIVYWFAAVIFFIFHPIGNILFVIGISLISFISFLDDVRTLNIKIRLVAQLISISMIFYSFQLQGVSSFYTSVFFIIAAYFISLGIVNAYNFMDGINGMTGLNTLLFFATCLYVNEYVFTFVHVDFLIFPIVASFVFLIFNFRKKAMCFAGDIGSVCIAFWIIFVLCKMIVISNSFVWLLLLVVYCIETGCTIIQRIYLRQNILKAHRIHLFQILSNEYHLDQRLVSCLYASFQLLLSVFMIYLYQNDYNEFVIFIVVLIPAILIYMIKFILIRNLKDKNLII